MRDHGVTRSHVTETAAGRPSPAGPSGARPAAALSSPAPAFPSASAALPSIALDAGTWDRAHDHLVADLRDLIRIPSINPPGDEILAARHVEALLADLGLRPEVVEPFPGRGSVACRLRGDGSGGGPLLLLSHLDVVPAPLDGWTHDPFAADIADGYVWGRGAVDMKAMVAMELGVIRLLVAEARAARRDPASDPIPGLRRDILFASTADEEAGGQKGAGWVVAHRPEWLRASAALNEAGGVSMAFAGRRVYPIQVAEKAFGVYRLTVRGTWGHGSMPRDDNAAVRAAQAIVRLSTPEPARLTPTMAAFLDGVAAALPPAQARLVRDLASSDPAVAERTVERLCQEPYRRALRALLRDTISVGIVNAGIKYNVIPGRAEVEIDCRLLPGTDLGSWPDRLRERLGPDLAPHVTIETVIEGAAVQSPLDHPIWAVMADTLRDHDPDAVVVPAMPPFATDAKHTATLGVPTYGFSPLRLDPEERFLDRFHGIDERVGLDALRFGLPVLYDVVRRYCS
ncbi:MAG TPA: M20/M25/M40 family metallo-hydrolase [Candidatus Limnocylindrales bacterium]